MAQKIFIGYKNIFGEVPFSNQKFLDKISLDLAIGISSYVGSRLYTRQREKEIQFELLYFFLRRQSQPYQRKIILAVQAYLNNGGQIFLSVYLDTFQKFCLVNCKEFKYDDFDIENDLLILKAYLSHADSFNRNFEIIAESSSQHEYFRKNNWPIYLSQIHHNIESNPMTSFFKGILLLDFFRVKEELSKSYYNYLRHYNISKHTQFLEILMKFVMNVIKDKGKFIIKTDDFGVNFFSNFQFNIEDLRKNGNIDLYIIGKPIYKSGDNSFYVLNYNYLANKLYHGVVFDFFSKSNTNFKNFLDFKSFLGKEFLEKILFRKVVSSLFRKEYYHTYFDEGEIEGFPDSLVIRKNKIFIFEVKDSLLSNKVINSKNYVAIQKEIDKFFVNKKGVMQITNFLKKIGKDEYFYSKHHRLNVSKLEIIPILIYTDSSFALPGIGEYLNEKFEEYLEKPHKFKKINPILFINIDFLIDYLDVLVNGNTKFESSISKIYSLMTKRKKLAERKRTIEVLDSFHEPFDSYYFSVNTVDEKRNSYVKFIFQELEIEKSI